MRLSSLMQGIDIVGCSVQLDIEISNIISDHRKGTKNSIFVAINGTKRNGNDYIENARKNGAIAVVTDSEETYKNTDNCVLVKNARRALAKMWSNYYGNPSRSIKTVAITGTNGKTSSAYFLYNILREAGVPCALISTIECLVNNERIETSGGGSVVDISSAMTTPDPEALYYLYNKMKEKDVKVAVIEASSHALGQERLSSVDIEIGAFTNLSREHLDYHKTVEQYFEAKKKLFEICKYCVVNIDDEYGCKLADIRTDAVCISKNEGSNFYATNIDCSAKGCKYDLVSNDGKTTINSSIAGDFTVYNTMLAVVCAKLLQIDNNAIRKGIKRTKSIKGRMEKYKDKSIYIDYAHTPKSVEQIIKSVRQIEPFKRLIVLFGCGGDRDKGKRAEMGKIATEQADYAIITTDNPRTEEPIQIINDIISEITEKNNYLVIPDRKEAITYLAKSIKENEVAVLLGKGHEEYEIIGQEKRYFNEREILNEVFKIDL